MLPIYPLEPLLEIFNCIFSEGIITSASFGLLDNLKHLTSKPHKHHFCDTRTFNRRGFHIREESAIVGICWEFGVPRMHGNGRFRTRDFRYAVLDAGGISKSFMRYGLLAKFIHRSHSSRDGHELRNLG